MASICETVLDPVAYETPFFKHIDFVQKRTNYTVPRLILQTLRLVA